MSTRGRLTAWGRCTLFDVNYRPANMTVAELENGFKELAVRLYSDEFTRWRRGGFKRGRFTQSREKGSAS